MNGCRRWPWGLAGIPALFALAWGLPVGAEVDAPAKPGIGPAAIADNARELPALSLEDLDGVRHGLAEWRGQVILLNFWATWCAPCQIELRELAHYQADWGPRGLQIIGVGLDEARKLGNVRRSLGIGYPILVADPTREAGLLAQWGDPAGTIPYTVVIDRDGQLRHTQRGPFDDEAFATLVRPLLQPAQAAGR